MFNFSDLRGKSSVKPINKLCTPDGLSADLDNSLACRLVIVKAVNGKKILKCFLLQRLTATPFINNITTGFCFFIIINHSSVFRPGGPTPSYNVLSIFKGG